jgi:hypothetical protein
MKTAQVGVAAVLVAVWSPVLAAPPTGLAYEAPRGCPTQPAFVAPVTARGVDFNAAEATKTRRVMVVSIRRQQGGFAGAFQVREDRDATNKREVRGSSCAEVADALAVVTAIALHAKVDAGGEGSRSGVGSSGTTTATVYDASGESPAGAPVAPPRAPADDAPGSPAAKQAAPPPLAPFADRLQGRTRAFPPPTESIAVHAGTLRFDLQRSVSAYAGATVGMIPSVVLPRYDLSLLGVSFITTPEGAQRIAGLVIKLHLGWLGPATYDSPDTKTDLSGLSFGIDLCQARYDSKGLVMMFCGSYGGGLMTVKTRGRDGAAIQSKETGWGEVVMSGEVQYYLGAGFHIGARVGGALTLGQITAERADGSRIFASAPWSAQATLGVGFRF